MPDAADRNALRGNDALAGDVLLERYASGSETRAETIQSRVASSLALPEAPSARPAWASLFLKAQRDGFLPAGRIMANAGSGRGATLINCFVQPSRLGAGEAGIAQALELARTTLLMGGGVGYDFSPLPPRASGVGPSVLDVIRRFEQACEGLARSNCRRCAQMGVLHVCHPDILEFIHAKNQGGLSNFNLSVAIDDDFMHALDNGGEIALRHRTPPANRRAGQEGDWIYARIKASELWRAFASRAGFGEPGVLFIDRINRDNNLQYCEHIDATNPCGEQPLPVFGGCDLGSLNLTRFVIAPFAPSARFDAASFTRTIALAVRMLDNVLDLTPWPLPEQRDESMAKRRIGLGLTGLADALMMLGLRYDSPQARVFTGRTGRLLRDTAYLASVRLARERGAFPLFNGLRYLEQGTFASRLPARIQALIAKHGIRNSHLLAIAPAGTISAAFGENVTSGIEPAFGWRYLRRRRLPDGRRVTYALENFAWRLFRDLGGNTDRLPAAFVTVHDMVPEDQIAMVAALTPFIDAGISKTVSLPASTTDDAVGGLYRLAWRSGLKGMTTFRPGSVLGEVLSVSGT